MNTIDLLNWAKDKVLAAGASDTVLSLSRQTNDKVEVRDGEIEKTKSGQSQGLSISVYIDGKFSRHSTNKLDPSALESFIKNAVEATRFLQSDPLREITPSALFPKEKKELALLDEQVANLSPEAMLDKAQQTYAAAQGHQQLISAKSSVSVSVSENHKLFSNGFYGEQKSSAISLSAEATLQAQGDRRAEDYAMAVSRTLVGLPAPSVLGEEAVARSVAQIGEAKIATGKFQLIVENRVSSRLVSILLGAMSAGALAQKRSFLDGKLGKTITAPNLSITDKPDLVGGFGSKLFDDEGVACTPRDLIRDGKLSNYLVDTYYGKKLGLAVNGASTSNLLFSGNTQPVSGILSSAKKAIWVKAFNGGNSNPVTGDYSFGISGLLIENGQVVKPVSEMVITGNILELFEHLAVLGDDPYPYGSMLRPTLVFDDVSCSGV